jgi:putative monooxygenase
MYRYEIFMGRTGIEEVYMSKLPFVKAADIKGEFREPARTSKLLLAPKFGGVENVSMGMNITEVGSMIPDHVHEDSEEVLFLISGKAKIVIEGVGEWEIGPETAFYSPKGKKHRVENIGNEPLKLVWVYSPPLPNHM